MYPNVSLGTNFTLSKGNVIDMTGFIIPSNDKFLLFLLNSKISQFVMDKIAISRRGGYHEYKVQYLSKIPLKIIEDSKKVGYVNIVDNVMRLNNNLYSTKTKFQSYLTSQFQLEKLSKKLQNWYTLEFADFIKEINKAIKANKAEKLTKLQEMEWMEVFEVKKAEAQTIKTQIDQTDKEIDAIVYELYGLTEEEIEIVENS